MSSVRLFLSFGLCKAINAEARIQGEAPGRMSIDLPDAFTPRAGSFAVLLEEENEHLFFDEEAGLRDRDYAVFEPWNGELEEFDAARVCLTGRYDSYHRWLEAGRVVSGEEVIVGEMIVGRLIAILRENPAGELILASTGHSSVSSPSRAREGTAALESSKIVPLSWARASRRDDLESAARRVA